MNARGATLCDEEGVSLISAFYVGALEVVMGEKVSPYLTMMEAAVRRSVRPHPPSAWQRRRGLGGEAEQEEQGSTEGARLRALVARGVPRAQCALPGALVNNQT